MIPIIHRNFKYIKGKNLRDLVEKDYNIKDKINIKILEDARKDLLELLFKRFIKENFDNNIKEATIIFQGNWSLPLYTDKNNYFGINTSDNLIDILLPFSLQNYNVLEYAMGLIEIVDNNDKVFRFIDNDIVFDNVYDVIIARPRNFPTYENLDDCIIEYNYFHNDTDKDQYRISKIAKMVNNDNIYFYDQQGELILDGN